MSASAAGEETTRLVPEGKESSSTTQEKYDLAAVSNTPPPPPNAATLRSDLTTITEGKTTQPRVLMASSSSFTRKSPVNSRSSSRPTSRSSSPTRSESSEELPTNVKKASQLNTLPQECLSDDVDRPLLHFDEMGEAVNYSLNPMTYSVIFILIIELLERFAFYGINYTQTSFLTGAYDKNWNAGMEAVSASTYVAVSVAVAYTTPFIGAVLADGMLGDYWTLLFGTLVFYLPGLILIALTTIPGVLGYDFNKAALATGLLFLWPVGTGIVKSVVNVFGARQFHPLLQSSLIESYYVNFYMSINIGALVGGIVVPLTAQVNVSVAYFMPVAMLTIGIAVFLTGTQRYVRKNPTNSDLFSTKVARPEAESFNLGVVLRISLLIIPFNIAYSQMSTTFIVQGTVMRKAFGFIDAACMNNADTVSVLLFGSLIGSHFYPWLQKRGIKIPTTYKFAIGSFFGVLAIGWALLVEHMIHHSYNEHGSKISILWQSMSYVFIGAGEIFAVSAAYEAAFSVSPPEKKVLASAVNLFCIGSLPNLICIFLYHACAPWFRNSRGTTNITRIHDYASAHVDSYFWLLFGIAVSGVFLNLIPAVKEFVEDVEEKNSDLIKTPKTPVRPPLRERKELDEESPLLRAQRHQAYLKYGSGPSLNRSGSMRAGANMTAKPKQAKHMKKRMLRVLYRDKRRSVTMRTPTNNLPPIAGLIPPTGTPPTPRAKLEQARLTRANSG
mmetsp:Transcript_5492/g.13866  ORF Transcript_5492/g.13866 Transcript_5492/m.13866 type:complete len:726 (-) Transcript_5492:3153-5330(-)